MIVFHKTNGGAPESEKMVRSLNWRRTCIIIGRNFLMTVRLAGVTEGDQRSQRMGQKIPFQLEEACGQEQTGELGLDKWHVLPA